MRCNIQTEIYSSFFSGGEEGFGHLFLTLRDTIFDTLKVFDHTAQLVDTIESQDPIPVMLTLQTDSGVDHVITQCLTKLSYVTLFRKLGLDNLMVIRCAPNDPAYNKIEHYKCLL